MIQNKKLIFLKDFKKKKMDYINIECKDGTLSVRKRTDIFCINISKIFESDKKIDFKNYDISIINQVYSIVNLNMKFNYEENLNNFIPVCEILKHFDTRFLKMFLDDFEEFCDYHNFRNTNIREEDENILKLFEIFEFIEINYNKEYFKNGSTIKHLKKLLKFDYEQILEELK
jgi:hypothetical protein